MQQLLDIANQGWVGTALGIIGLFAAWWFYRKAKAIYLLRWTTQSVGVVVPHRAVEFGEQIAVFYRRDPVQQLTASEITFWNGGNSTIDGSSVAAKDPIRVIIAGGGDILEASCKRVSRDACGVQTELTADVGSDLTIRFDYLDPGDGAVLSILHTGLPYTERLHGAIRGGQLEKASIVRYRAVLGPMNSYRVMRRVLLLAFLSALYLSIAPDSWQIQLHSLLPPRIDGAPGVTRRILTLAFACLFAALYFTARDGSPRSEVPASLRDPKYSP